MEEEALHFLDRHERFVEDSTRDLVRVYRRYEAIVAANADLFLNARVLDLASGDGCWSLAALDAGADRVVGIDSAKDAVKQAEENFRDYGVDPGAYQFIHSEIGVALRRMKPDEFDLVLCQGYCEFSDVRVLFSHFSRLRPRHVILDTGISRGEGPVLRYMLDTRDAPALERNDEYAEVLAVPNHEMIVLLCDYFKFRWQQVDWTAMGIDDWTGIHDYERDRRRTYVLERL